MVGRADSTRGGYQMIYQYYVPETNQYYKARTAYDCEVGDTIEILYNPKKPQLSNSKEYISKKKH